MALLFPVKRLVTERLAVESGPIINVF